MLASNEDQVLLYVPNARDSMYLLGHLSHSSDLLLWVRVFIVVCHALTSSSQELLGQS